MTSPPPEPSAADRAYAVAKAAISAIPMVGGPGAELLSSVFSPPIERRRQRWLHELALVIDRLTHEQATTVDRLQADERFISVVLHATEVALRHSQDERLKWLRNGLMNSAIPSSGDEERDIRFVAYIDALGPHHVALLEYVATAGEELQSIASFEEFYTKSVPALAWSEVDRDTFRAAVEDLSSRSLIRVSPQLEDFQDVFRPTVVTTGDKTRGPMLRLTTTGRAFLQYLKDPFAAG